ncbi:hypothetical protein SADUNF_Sadunf03G0161500 [Salix dunnii]|uniref:Enoyl-ACP reductase n=1 Tax=Salix dunnii TaxID=1413687 RepID=A0A835N549_9ROSI|nr:hypothetical protein SADUNF_Sadunf03G0161500 [Salix dunnii]
MPTARPCISSHHGMVKAGAAILGDSSKGASWAKLARGSHRSSIQPFQKAFMSSTFKLNKAVTRAKPESGDSKPTSGLPIDLRGKRAFIAAVADDNGYGWAIAKSLAASGAETFVGTWVPIYVSSDLLYGHFLQEVAESVKQDFGSNDILMHSLANGPEVSEPLLEHQEKDILQPYCIQLLVCFFTRAFPSNYESGFMLMRVVHLFLSHTLLQRGSYRGGGGLSSAKAALESDTRVLAFEAGRKNRIRVNTISAGPLRSRAAKAIGFIDTMIEYSLANAPLQKELSADEVGNAAAFLASPLASAITGTVMYVDNGLNAMGVSVDSPIFKDLDIPKDKH